MKPVLLRRCANEALPWILLLAGFLLVWNQTARPQLLIRVLIPWAEVGVLAFAMTAIILTGGIDLSVGSIAAFSGVTLGLLTEQFGLPVPIAVCGAILGGTAAGAFNGLLIAKGLPSLVTTLATMAFFRGLALLISGAKRVAGFPDDMLALRSIAGLPTQFWFLLLIGLTAWILIHATRWGRWCFAIGDNRQAARFAGIPDHRTDFALYTISGCIAGTVAVLNCIQHDTAVPDAFRGIELQVIACVVVGGTLITGGHGSVGRTILGLAIVASLDTGLMLLSFTVDFLTAESRLIVTGMLLILLATWNQRLRIE